MKILAPNLLIYGTARLFIGSVLLNILPNFIKSKRGKNARKA